MYIKSVLCVCVCIKVVVVIYIFAARRLFPPSKERRARLRRRRPCTRARPHTHTHTRVSARRERETVPGAMLICKSASNARGRVDSRSVRRRRRRRQRRPAGSRAPRGGRLPPPFHPRVPSPTASPLKVFIGQYKTGGHENRPGSAARARGLSAREPPRAIN